MKIYNVIDNCHGDDTTAIPFLDLDKAIAYARKEAKRASAKYPEDYKEKEIKGWLFCVEYCCEGDMIWITEHDMEETK